MALYKRLLAGRVSVTDTLFVEVVDRYGRLLEEIHPRELVGGGWGTVYERVVGQHYEDLGYRVDYRGARLGFRDQGVDLVACSDTEQRFVQCKFLLHTFSPQRVEQVLFKASALVKRSSQPGAIFELAMPSLALAFPTRRTRTGREVPNRALARLLAANMQQARVRVIASEVPLPINAPRFDPVALGIASLAAL